MTGRQSQAHEAFQRTVEQALQLRGCVTNHVYPLRTRDGWRTAHTLQGWPDLTAFHPKRWMLAVEVKVPPDTLKTEQRAVLSLWAEIPCARAWVVKPNDPPWSTFLEWLANPKDAPQVYGFELADDPRRLLAEAELARQRRKAARFKRTRRESNGRRGDALTLDL